MNSTILDYIRALTLKDKKTLSQKALKTMEEVGELSRAILPYENDDGTMHRFADKEDIIEEAIDTILCSLSIAYDVGATDEQIEKMLWKKSEYWNTLQLKESESPFPLPFEIHVTVNEKDQDKFRKACALAGVKKINLDLFDSDGYVIKHEAMTASKIIGTNIEAYKELNRICEILSKEKIIITRRKIETVPWHPGASFTGMGKNYFECHFDLKLDNTTDFLKMIRKVSDIGGAISLNKNKEIKSYLVTYRTTSTLDYLKEKIKVILQSLETYHPSKPLIEFAIYDTDVSLDDDWLNH